MTDKITVLVTGGGGGSLDGLAAQLIRYLGAGNNGKVSDRPTPNGVGAVTDSALVVAADSARGAGEGEDRSVRDGGVSGT